MNEASEDLEREAERVRAQLSDTADELRARVSPGQIMDDMLNAIRDGGATEMLDNLMVQVRANPVAVAMIGGGLAWLMLGKGSSDRDADRQRDYDGGRTFDSRRDYLDRDRTADLSETAGSVMERVTNATGATGEAVGGALRGAATAAEHHVRDAADTLRHGARDAMQGMRDGSHRARGAVNHAIEREPLLIGAMGFAAGALVGAIIPTSEMERRNLGPAGEVLKEKAGALVDEGVAMAREVAGNRTGTEAENRQPEGAPA